MKIVSMLLLGVFCACIVHAQEIVSPNRHIKVTLVSRQSKDEINTRR